MMDAASWSAIVGPITTLLGGVGGYWLAGRNDDARDRRASLREAEARRAALAERLEEDRHTFQRETLLELQDQLQRLARITTRIIMQDQKTLKELGQLYLLPDGLSDEEFTIFTAIQRLWVRILDPDLRQGVGDFVNVCSRASMLGPVQDKDQAASDAMKERGLPLSVGDSRFMLGLSTPSTTMGGPLWKRMTARRLWEWTCTGGAACWSG
jgi:hypothetical protein